MGFSFVAMHRMCEREKNKFSPEEIVGMVFVSDGRALSDEELIEKLKSFGIDINKATFLQMVKRFSSAEEMFYWYINQEHPQVKLTHGIHDDWIWTCLVVLWERWAPDQPSFEMLDDLIQNGYDLLMQIDYSELGNYQEEGCEMWLKAWAWILKIMDERNFKTIDDFDNNFAGTQDISNWVQDLEMELWNAGQDDSKYLKARIKFTGEYIKRFPFEDKHILQNMKKAFAETHFKLGKTKKTASLFEEWLEEDPQWGWGWIGYSDCYWLDFKEKQDFKKGEEILKRGLDVPGVEDQDDIIDRLINLYEESDRPDEAEKWSALLPPPAPMPFLGEISKVKHLIPSKKKRKKKKKK